MIQIFFHFFDTNRILTFLFNVSSIRILTFRLSELFTPGMRFLFRSKNEFLLVMCSENLFLYNKDRNFDIRNHNNFELHY